MRAGAGWSTSTATPAIALSPAMPPRNRPQPRRSIRRRGSGPEYTEPENLERLRERGLGRKGSLALREFALGIEALERFVRG